MDAQTASEITASLKRMGVATCEDDPEYVALAGGVSSDIWRVSLGRRTVCVKRALPKLRVEAEWCAPVARNGYEVEWMKVAASVVPEAVVPLLGHDPEAGLFVMDYLDSSRYYNWKAALASGRAEAKTAAMVGDRLGRIHDATALDPKIAERFGSDVIFHDIRLEPYLAAAARAHPDCGKALEALIETTANTRLALVHGDVSPKNILVGPEGPVLLDAECAWYGDPAFDVAFCLNHLLLKCLWVPSSAGDFLGCFDALWQAYSMHLSWEQPSVLNARAARLLPGLLLARVDGKSPVEYLTGGADKDRVRRAARDLLLTPVDDLAQVRARWVEELSS